MTPEMESLETAIAHAEYEIARVSRQLDTMRQKQCDRREELGYQRARAKHQVPRHHSDEPIAGGRAIIVQTDAGIATRYLPPSQS